MGYKKMSKTLNRPHGYTSVPDNPFRSMILHPFFANIPWIQDLPSFPSVGNLFKLSSDVRKRLEAGETCVHSPNSAHGYIKFRLRLSVVFISGDDFPCTVQDTFGFQNVGEGHFCVGSVEFEREIGWNLTYGDVNGRPIGGKL